MYCCVNFTRSPYLDNNLSLSIHTLYTLGSMTSVGPLGQSQGGGARGQNLELSDFFFPFYFLIETT